VAASGARTLAGPPARLADFAATVFDLLGVPLPEPLDGAPIALGSADPAGAA
jgi:hypothetical protein